MPFILVHKYKKKKTETRIIQIPLGFRDINGSPNLGQTTRPYNIKKRTWKIVDLAVPADYRVKLEECEKRDKYFDIARELKKTVEYESDENTNCNWCSWYSHQRISTRPGGLGNDMTSGNNPNYCVIEIG